MGKMTLVNGLGQTLAEISDETPVVETGAKDVLNNKDCTEITSVYDGTTGYVEDEVLDEISYSVVEIPANFAGLEAVMVPPRIKDQFFDITEVVEGDDYVEITALHVWYRLRQDITQWDANNNTRYSGAAACRNIMTWQMSDLGFRVASDCTDLLPGGCFDYERKNIATAFLDPESGLCAQYGLSLIRDNYNFYCLKNVGYFRGFIIEDGKNLLGVERKENIENTVTRVAPVGKDEDGEYRYLYGQDGKEYVDSPHIGDYPVPRMEIYLTDLEIGEDGTTEENIDQKLYDYARERFADDEADIPEITMTISFLSLGDTEEYQQYRNLDKVYLYDIVQIINKERGYNYAAQVVSVEYNILTQQLESVTIGTPQKWGSTRKIGTWQLPELSGTKIRQKTIRAGLLADDSVTSSAMSSGSVTSSSLSSSAISTFETVFAEQLYISNTSEDGLLNTRFQVSEGLIQSEITDRRTQGETLSSAITQNSTAITAEVTRATAAEGTMSGRITVEAGKISQIVSAVGADGEVTAASIVLAINQSTGESEAKIDAQHVYIGNDKSTTVIGGKLSASDITADFLNAKISSIPTLSGISASFSGNVSVTGGVMASAIYVGSSAPYTNISDGIAAVQIDGPTNNEYKLQYKKFSDSSWQDAGTFSRATSLTDAWGSGTYTVTASPQGDTKRTTLSIANIHQGVAANSENTKHYYGKVQGTRIVSGSTVTVDTGTTIDVDASSVYEDGSDYGYGRAKITRTWSGSTCTISKSTSGSNSIAITASAGITYDSSSHKYTAKATVDGSVRDTAASGTEAYNDGFNATRDCVIGGVNGSSSNPDQKTDVTISSYGGSLELWPYWKKTDGSWTWGTKCTVRAPSFPSVGSVTAGGSSGTSLGSIHATAGQWVRFYVGNYQYCILLT